MKNKTLRMNKAIQTKIIKILNKTMMRMMTTMRMMKSPHNRMLIIKKEKINFHLVSKFINFFLKYNNLCALD